MLDFNVDLGEGGLNDAALLACASSCNIACGGHAGDEVLMRTTVALAEAVGVAIGAHPGYEDRKNFGRVACQLPRRVVVDLVARQVERLAQMTGGTLHHVKPHGALYNQAHRETELAAAVIEGICKVVPGVAIYAMPVGALRVAAQEAGLRVMAEGFADRRYRPDGTLVPRDAPGAVISDVSEAVEQAMELSRSGRIDTLCVHGEGPLAVAMLRAIRQACEFSQKS